VLTSKKKKHTSGDGSDQGGEGDSVRRSMGLKFIELEKVTSFRTVKRGHEPGTIQSEGLLVQKVKEAR